eukprot:CAMPEP_0202507198 /NCGR_PEP_ID=MMETSP1361-20130828/51594_1 /ASSEMBLY_ACC=CAM_ASM_000849 /TAXON_ID=210615 /ORGANISM="Staurosira complex sp., Strain CCMP2646" /LENGTH=557 /DNA_ID=CAMNT_0049141305 /DNA_START=2378 /DNA_END=4051 /DNA_ORIENTATION=-
MKILFPITLALAACDADASLRAAERRLSFEKIAEYEPLSKVTDHNAIDLDQMAMEEQLGLETTDSYAKAKNIYQNGAHSKPIAEVTITGGAPAAIPEGAEVIGKTTSGQEVRGQALEAAASGASVLRIQYNTSPIQEAYVDCQVGALEKDGNTEGCLASNGTLTIDGFSDPVTYNYNIHTDNNNGRTLAGFSTEAQAKMYECPNCPYPDYEKFRKYYDVFDYANQWVLAAFAGGKTSFANGNADFSGYSFSGRTEAIKKGTAYMNVWMYVIREMEDALDDCKAGCINCNDDPVHAWDEAVAFYTGSQQEGGASTDGYLLYALANKRCINFKTCGPAGDSVEGSSKVNTDIFREFNIGQGNLVNGKCDSARQQKEKIAAFMAIPLVQGTLRYAYLTDTSLTPSVSEKSQAEGAVFAASVLPIVHACSPSDAQTIYNNMAVGSQGAKFVEVKAAFERNYGCMGISGSDVGGLYDSATEAYFTNAEPSSAGSDSSSGGLSGGAIAGICIAAAVVVFAVAFLVFRNKSSAHGVDKDFPSGAGSSSTQNSNVEHSNVQSYAT